MSTIPLYIKPSPPRRISYNYSFTTNSPLAEIYTLQVQSNPMHVIALFEKSLSSENINCNFIRTVPIFIKLYLISRFATHSYPKVLKFNKSRRSLLNIENINQFQKHARFSKKLCVSSIMIIVYRNRNTEMLK